MRTTVPLATAVARFGDTQGNILRNHGRARAAHAFLTFGERPAAVRNWIATYARTSISSCAAELAISDTRRPFRSLLLSASGYRTLGIAPPPERSFRDGMKSAALNDPPVETWDEPFRRNVDAMLIMAADERAVIDHELGELEALQSLCSAFSVEHGAELPGGIEHYGFVDGISQPIFIDEDLEVVRSRKAGKLTWDPATPLHVAIVRDPHGQTQHSYGSYLVFRKLRQDKEVFDQGLAAMAKSLGVSVELAGAMVVGRFKDGTPLSAARSEGLGPENDFNFGDDPIGALCPFASHVRRVNPRGELDHVAHTPDWQNRIARRGMPYGQPGDPELGLLFMCYQSDIAQGFELIQSNWCNFPDFPVIKSGPDPLVGQRNSWDSTVGQKWSVPSADGTFAAFDFPQSVTVRGGEYFFAPSIGFLKSLALE